MSELDGTDQKLDYYSRLRRLRQFRPELFRTHSTGKGCADRGSGELVLLRLFSRQGGNQFHCLVTSSPSQEGDGTYEVEGFRDNRSR